MDIFGQKRGPFLDPFLDTSGKNQYFSVLSGSILIQYLPEGSKKGYPKNGSFLGPPKIGIFPVFLALFDPLLTGTQIFFGLFGYISD